MYEKNLKIDRKQYFNLHIKIYTTTMYLYFELSWRFYVHIHVPKYVLIFTCLLLCKKEKIFANRGMIIYHPCDIRFILWDEICFDNIIVKRENNQISVRPWPILSFKEESSKAFFTMCTILLIRHKGLKYAIIEFFSLWTRIFR